MFHLVDGMTWNYGHEMVKIRMNNFEGYFIRKIYFLLLDKRFASSRWGFGIFNFNLLRPWLLDEVIGSSFLTSWFFRSSPELEGTSVEQLELVLPARTDLGPS